MPTLLALLPERTLPFTTVPESFELDARAVGRIEALDTVNIALYGDAGSSLRLHGRLAQWMGSEKAEYDLVIDPFTMGAGVRAIAQAYVPTDAPFPHDLTLRAHANGSSEDVRADLDLATDRGHLQGLVSASGMRGSAPDAVTLDLRADHIALARLLADTAWDRTDLRIRAEGVHLNTAQRSGWLEIAPDRFGYGHMDFRDLQLRAELNGDSISAKGHVRSVPLHLELDAQGRLAGGKDSLALDVSLHVPHADLNMLGVVEHDLVVAGNWAARAALDTAGHGTIALWMDSTLLESVTRQFRFGEFRAQAYSGADSTSAHVQSDAVDLAFAGNTAFDTLLIHAMDKGRSFFTHDTLFHPTPGEQLEVRLDLKRTDLLTGLLFPKLHAIDLEKFEARYDGDKDELAASLILPYFRYDSLVVSGVDLQVEGAAADLTATLLTTRIAQGSFAVDGLSLDVNSRGGELQALMRIAQEDSLRYRIGMRMRTKGEERIIQLDPEPVLDARTWTVDTANSVRFGPTSASADHFELRSGVEAIALRTPTNALEIALDGFRISTLANIISTRDTVPLADGSIDGTVRFPQEDASGIAADLTVRDLAFMGTAMGTLDVGFIEPAPDVYHGTARLHSAENTLDATVDIAADNLRAKADLDLRDIAFLQPFASEYLYALGGGVAGKIDYSDHAGHSTMRGRMDLRDTHVGVVLTGATYTLVNESVIFTESGMRLANVTLRDSIGNVFVLDGDVRTEGSVDPMLDLRIRTDRFHLISSTFEQNPRFYGELYVGMGLQVSGPVKRPRASGDLNILSGTDLSVVLPGSTVELVSTEGIVVFTDGLYASDTAAVATDAEALRDSLAAHLPGAELDLRIRVDKDARFAIVLDPAAGDQATVSGSADLVFRYAPREQMFLSGPFTVESGEYTLDLYGLVKKRFELTKGGTIRWSGDPVKAEMDLQARFLSETAPFALLPSSAGTITSERNRLQQPLPFAVLINIDGSISEPVVGFGLDLDRQLRNSFPKVNNRLDQLNQQGNEEELNRQVFGLLVLNSFIQDESSGGAPSSGIATSAARNSVNGLLTDQMNKLTGRYIKGVDISLGVNTYDQASGQSTYQRTSLDYRVSKRILDERLSFEVGGSVGVDEQGSQVSNVSSTRAAQYAILYDLTRDGRFRIRGFHENAYDLYDGEITNSGVAIMFTRDFEENARARTQGREAAKKRMEADEKRIGEDEKDQVPPVPPEKDR